MVEDRRAPASPSPPPSVAARTPHGIQALLFVLGPYSYPCDIERLWQQAGETSFEFRRGERVKLRDVLELIEAPRQLDSLEEAVATVLGALDERRGVDRRVSPPRAGRADTLEV